MSGHIEQIPNGWGLTSIDRVCEILDSRRVPVNAKERNERITNKKPNELYPYYGATGQVGTIDGYLFDGEHLLLGEDGAPFFDHTKDTAYLVSGRFWVNNHAHILKAYVSNKYLCYYLNQFDFTESVTGTTRLKLNQASLKEIPVWFAPENEQHRIVAKIEELFSELDKGIESLKTAREQLKVYRQALLKHAFEGKLTEQWRAEHGCSSAARGHDSKDGGGRAKQDARAEESEAAKDNASKLETADQLLERIKQAREARYQQQLEEWKAAVKQWEVDGLPAGQAGKEGRKPAKPKKPTQMEALDTKALNELDTLPDGWAWQYFGSVCYFENGDRGKNYPNRSEYAVSGIPWINTGHIEPDGSLSAERMHHISREKFETLRSGKIQPGDLVYCLRGATFGKTAFVDPYEEGAIASSLMIIRPHYPLTARYIYSYLLSPLGKNQLQRFDNGSAQPNLSGNSVRQYHFPLCSIAEQDEITRIIEEQLETISRFERELGDSLAQSEALRQSILKKAFSGQLVPQDSNDEPASALLERIAKEKEQVVAKAKKAKAAKKKPKTTRTSTRKAS